MGYWPRHPKKDIEAVLIEFDLAGWTIDRSGYYRAKCSCGLHQKRIALTPSGSNYAKNLRQWLYRQPCYDKEAAL